MLFVGWRGGGSIQVFRSCAIVRCDCNMDKEPLDCRDMGEVTSLEILPLGSFGGVWGKEASHADANFERDMIGIRRDGRG